MSWTTSRADRAGRRVLRHDPTSVRTARHAVLDDLAAGGLARAALDDVALVVSELVGNAVRHARPLPDGHLVLVWQARPAVVPDVVDIEVAVTDGGSATTPHRMVTPPDAYDGRGLAIVASVSSSWTVDTAAADGSVTVRAQIPARATAR